MKYYIVAMRGRNHGGEMNNAYPCQKWHQQLEINKENVCNSLTTVAKDNLVLICKKDFSDKHLKP